MQVMVEGPVRRDNLESLMNDLSTAFSGRLLRAPDEVAPYLSDYRNKWTGTALGVAIPHTVDDVSQLVLWCARNNVAIVPQGGNTGMVGGSVPRDFGRSLVVSLAGLNKILSLDPTNNTITVQAGCVLAVVQQAAHDAERLFPLSLGSEGTCTIGGNLASNAGGTQVLRYGNARDLCLGLEVVGADGQIWNGLRGLRKDNTGYDLKHLYIGSEGTLGIITAATLKLYPKPAAQMTAFVAVQDAKSVIELLARAQHRLSATLTAFEIIDRRSIETAERYTPCVSPVGARTPFYVLLETSDPVSAESAQASFEGLLENALEADVIVDAAIATSLAQSQTFWSLRHHLTDAQAKAGRNIKHDISLPISSIPDFLAHAGSLIDASFPEVQVMMFGHVGDGNLHYNVIAPVEADADAEALETRYEALSELVYATVARYHGSISAEHGVGSLKVDEISQYKSPVEMQLMSTIKKALDPQNLFNPGRVLAV